MNILVIGGARYIGSVVVERLIKNHKIVVLDDLSTGFKELVHKDAKFVLGTMLDQKLVENIIKENSIELVICLAAKIVVPESVAKPLEYYETNIHGIINVVQALKNTNCKNIIFSSSAAVYGVPKSVPIREDDIKDPCNPYGRSKLACEWVITDAAKVCDINYAIFRFFNVAGASSSNDYGMMKKKPSLLISCINDCFINNKVFNIYGNQYNTIDKTALRDYVHVSDLASAHELAIEMLKQNKSGIFNLGSGTGYTVKQVYDTAVAVLNQKPNFVYQPNRPGDPDKLLTDYSLANKVLGWKPTHSLTEMIVDDFNFRNKHCK